MTTKLTWKEFQRIRDIKVLDLEICDYGHLNILNLGWEAWGKWFCEFHEKEHVLCPSLCLPASRNIIGCILVRIKRKKGEKKVTVNQEYYKAGCYLCGKELKGAGKHGVVKNRNNPRFWGIITEFKVLCLKCLGKKYLSKLSGSKRKSYLKYVKRGYV